MLVPSPVETHSHLSGVPCATDAHASVRSHSPVSPAAQTTESSREMTEVTLELIRELLREDYPDVVINEFEGAPGSNRGDNYTSMVYRITLKGIRKYIEPDGSSATEEPWEGSLIYKCLPESMSRREAFKSDELFRNEVAFYNQIWPAMCSFQAMCNVKPLKAIPKCYLARNDCVILKDLKQYGFVMPDRRKGLTVSECYMVMENLSQFHAMSMAMKIHDPEKFFELINGKDGINEVLFMENNIEYYRSYYQEAIQNAIDMVEEELKDSDTKDYYLEKFRTFCSEETFFQMMVDMVKPQEPTAVICHGDCWINNFQFRYADGEIKEMYLVDFQLVRYASLALDLAYMLFLCLERSQRSAHLPGLLRHYAVHMHATLMSALGAALPPEWSEDGLHTMIVEELKKCAPFGLGVALDMYPILTCDSDEAPNLYQTEDAGASSSEHGAPTPVWTSNAACRRKMTDLVQELVDSNII